MRTAAPPEFYDEAMTSPDALALLPLEDSPWLPLYHAAAAWVEPWQPVVDLGAGTGRFAKALSRTHGAGYYGFDFSPQVVAEAAGYCHADGFTFAVADIRQWEHGPDLPDECCYVLLEVLEHLDDDRDIFARIPPGQQVVLSVPNYWSASHVRRFLQPRDVFDRYGDLLDFDAWQSIPHGIPGRRIHLFRGMTRADRL